MTFDLSEVVNSVIEEYDDARKMLKEDPSNEKAREFVCEKTKERFSGDVRDLTVQSEVRTVAYELAED